jgi:hypothetical protein
VQVQSNPLGIDICKCYMCISKSIPHLLFNASLGHRRFALKGLPRILGTSELPQHIMRGFAAIGVSRPLRTSGLQRLDNVYKKEQLDTDLTTNFV